MDSQTLPNLTNVNFENWRDVPDRSDVIATARIPVEAGLAVRGGIKRLIMATAWQHDLTCSVEEDKGLLESLYMFTIEGDSCDVRALMREMAFRFAEPDERRKS